MESVLRPSGLSARSADSPDRSSLIIDTGRPFSIVNIPDFHAPVTFKMPPPCSARYSNLHRANIHYFIRIIKTYRRTRSGFGVILISSAHLFWNDTSSKVSEPTCSFALRSKLSTSSHFKLYEWSDRVNSRAQVGPITFNRPPTFLYKLIRRRVTVL
jgi:hypothetical protein